MEEEESLTDDKIDTDLNLSLFDGNNKTRKSVIECIGILKDTACGEFLFEMWRNPDFLKRITLLNFLKMVYDYVIKHHHDNYHIYVILLTKFFGGVSRFSGVEFDSSRLGTCVIEPLTYEKIGDTKKVAILLFNSFKHFKDEYCLKKQIMLLEPDKTLTIDDKCSFTDNVYNLCAS